MSRADDPAAAVSRPAPAPAGTRRRRRRGHGLGRATQFFSTPKGMTLVVLLVLLAAAERHAGPHVLPEVCGAVFGAVVSDLAIEQRLRSRLPFPSGALLTGLIVGAIISPTSPWYVFPATAAIAVASKHLIRTRWSNVFNPAALALVASYFLFRSEQSWWGALPDLPGVWVVLLIGLGLFIAAKVNKLTLVLVFLGTALTVFTAASFAGDASLVAEIYRAPDINALIFFATLMLTDPPTSPAKPGHQVWFALLVAAASCFAFLRLGALWFLAGGLLVGNAWESARRVAHRRSVEAGRLRRVPT